MSHSLKFNLIFSVIAIIASIILTFVSVYMANMSAHRQMSDDIKRVEKISADNLEATTSIVRTLSKVELIPQ